MFKTIKKSSVGGMKQLYYIEIASTEIENKKKILLQKPNTIKLVFAEICEIDPRSVNVILCIAIQNGIRIAFEVHSQIFQSKSSVEMLELLRNSIHNLSQSIKTAWKLNEIPNIQKIDLVGEDEKMGASQKHKNVNFSIQVKRSSISSNRFLFSLDLNNKIEQQQHQNTQIIQPNAISLKAIQQINKEKEEMDQIDANSSYWGSVRNLNAELDAPAAPSHSGNSVKINSSYLKPNSSHDSVHQKKKRQKKGNETNDNSTHNLSILVQGPSSYNSSENMHTLELVNSGSITDTSMSIGTISDSDEPSPNNIDNIMRPDLKNNIKLAFSNNNSLNVEAGSRSNSIIKTDRINNANPLQINQNDNRQTIEINNIPNSNPMMNHRLSLDDQYVKPTLANADSYDNTEVELDDIMMNVMVEQDEQLAKVVNNMQSPKILSPIIEGFGDKNNINQQQPPIIENNLDLNDDMTMNEESIQIENDEEEMLEIGTNLTANCDAISILTNVVTSNINHTNKLVTVEFKTDEKENKFYSDTNIILSSKNKPQTSAEIAATFVKRQSEKKEHKTQYSIQYSCQDEDSNKSESDSDNHDDNTQIVIKVNSDNSQSIKKNQHYRPRTQTSPPQQLYQKIKQMPSHKLPPAPRKNTAPISILHTKSLPLKPLPHKPLPHYPLPQRGASKIPINNHNVNNNRISNY